LPYGSGIRKIAFVSDLHMGVNGSKTCGLKQDDQRLASYFQKLLYEDDYDLLVVAGDCFELWEPAANSSKVYGKPMSRELFSEIIKTWPMTCDLFFNDNRVVLLNGNHDAATRTKGFIEKSYADLVVEDMRLYAAHGHQSDTWCSDDSVLLNITKMATRVYGHYELVRHHLDEDETALAASIKTAGTKKGDIRALSHAEMMAVAEGHKVVVYGHTHNAMLFINDNVLYCNSGNCCTERDVVDQIDVCLKITDCDDPLSNPEGSFARKIIIAKRLKANTYTGERTCMGEVSFLLANIT